MVSAGHAVLVPRNENLCIVVFIPFFLAIFAQNEPGLRGIIYLWQPGDREITTPSVSVELHMSCIVGDIKGDTRSLNYRSYGPRYDPGVHFIFHFLFHLVLHHRSY